MNEKNAQDRFGSLAEKSVDEMTEEELRKFPEEWLLRYGRSKKREGEIQKHEEGAQSSHAHD